MERIISGTDMKRLMNIQLMKLESQVSINGKSSKECC
mgnify:CR=1 FL=1